MVYFSELIGKPIFDKNSKKIARLKDFNFIDKSRYAIISGVIVEDSSIKIIPWKYIGEIREKAENGFPVGVYLNEGLKNIIFSDKEDRTLSEVMDKQLMDINGARIIRVNDILLGRTEKKMIIVGVDIGTKGLLRRLGIGFLPIKIDDSIILWKDVADLSKNDKGITLKVKIDRINEMHPADIADMIRDLNLEEKEMIFNSLDNEKAAETLLTSQPDIQKSFFKTLSIKKIATMLETLPADDSAAILNMMPTINNIKVLRQMKPGIAAKVKKILSYDKKTAGSLMSTRFLTIPESISVKKATEYIRKQVPKAPHIFYLYVSGEDNELRGVISLRDLILADSNNKVSNIVNSNILTVNEHSDIDEVFNLMSKYSLLALPVIDKNKKIVGVIRINDILEVMIPRRIKKQRILKRKKLISNNADNSAINIP